MTTMRRKKTQQMINAYLNALASGSFSRTLSLSLWLSLALSISLFGIIPMPSKRNMKIFQWRRTDVWNWFEQKINARKCMNGSLLLVHLVLLSRSLMPLIAKYTSSTLCLPCHCHTDEIDKYDWKMVTSNVFGVHENDTWKMSFDRISKSTAIIFIIGMNFPLGW